jgi:SAM-dependent methyltransferase
MPPPPHHAADVERYYEFIYRWTQLTNRFRAFNSADAYPIHRGLADPETGEFSTDTVHRMIAKSCPSPPGLRVLDAGCGYGGTCIAMHKLVGGIWDGITISRRQARIADRNIAALGLRDHVSVRVASFDSPQPHGYSGIIGIESLIHAMSPAATIRNLVPSLAPGGRFIIVDDMPVPDVPARLATDLKQFKAMWRCPVMPTAAEWARLLEAEGCPVEATVDLTPHMRPRSESDTVLAFNEVNRARRWRDRIGLRMVSDAQAGGLHLERLAREGAVQYVMIVARKRA